MCLLLGEKVAPEAADVTLPLIPEGEGREETDDVDHPKPPQIIPYLIYRDIGAALDFLCHAFGFKEQMRTGTPSGGMHGEASFQGQLVMMGQGAHERSLKTPKDAGAATMGVFIYLDDVDKHYEVAKAAGADIVHPPKDVEYGRTHWRSIPRGIPGSSPRRRKRGKPHRHADSIRYRQAHSRPSPASPSAPRAKKRV